MIPRHSLLLLLAVVLMCACTTHPTGDAATLCARAGEAAESGDYATAIALASDALDRMDSDTDPTLRADALMTIGHAHAAAGNDAAALAYAREARMASPGYAAARRYLVDAATRAGEYTLALEELDSIPAPDAASEAVTLRQRAAAALGAGHTEVAAGALRRLYADSLWLPVEQRAALARIYLAAGRRDSAAIVMAGADSETAMSAADLRALATYHAATGDDSAARDALLRLDATQDSLLRTIAAARIYGNLYSQEHERLMAQTEATRTARLRLTIAIVAALAALTALTAALLYARARHRRRYLEAENRLLLAGEELDRLAAQSRSDIGRLFRDSYDSVEMAANMLIDSSASANVAANIRRRLEMRVEACRKPEFLATLEAQTDRYRDGAMATLRSRVNPLSDADIKVALYCAAGLSPRVICMLLDCSPSALYNKKYRLKGKIRACGAPDTEVQSLLAMLD